MSAKHTPGPWMYVGDDKWIIPSDGTFVQFGKFNISANSVDEKDDDYYFIGSVSNVNSFSENEANARLIAAAPELLEFAKIFLADYQSEDGMYSMKRYAEMAYAAIAKAEGGAA